MTKTSPVRQTTEEAGEKKVSNEEWTSPVDPDSRIIKMKDGRTHLGYKSEHVVDLKSEYILSADVVHGTDSDSGNFGGQPDTGSDEPRAGGQEAEIKEVAADKGYHANQTLLDCEEMGVRTYIPQRETGRRRWTDKPPETEVAYRNNGRRVKREKGKRLQRIRSGTAGTELRPRLRNGRARRTWLRGLEKINKRYQVHTAARNLGLLMRDLFGIGKPRVLQDGLDALEEAAAALCAAWLAPIAARWPFAAHAGMPHDVGTRHPPKLAAI